MIMGWMFLQKDRGQSIKDFFKQEFNYQKDDGRYGKVIDCAVVNLTAAYITYETNQNGSKEVVALVCLLRFVPRAKDGFNFGYKDMDETMGPNECNCPERILKLLTPTSNKNALRWREKCWKNIQTRKVRPPLRKGMVIEFDRPLEFRGGYNTFVKVFRVDIPRLLWFSDRSGHSYKIPRDILKTVPYHVIPDFPEPDFPESEVSL